MFVMNNLKGENFKNIKISACLIQNRKLIDLMTKKPDFYKKPGLR